MAMWEQVKERQALFRSREKSVLVILAEAGIHLLLGAILASATVFGRCTPFGIAAVAAAGTGLPGLMTLIGSLVGYIAFQGTYGGLHYGAAAVLTFALIVALQDLKPARSAWFAPAVAAVFCGICSFIYLSGLGFTGGDVIFYVTEIFLVAAGAYYFRGGFAAGVGKSGQIELLSTEQRVGVAALGGACLIALSGVLLFHEYSLGRIAAAAVVMASARRGPKTGLMGGTLAGIAMDAASGRGPYYCMMFALSGLMAGLSHEKSRLATALTYVAANSAVVLWTWQSGMRISLLYEVLLAAALFMLIPQKLYVLGGKMLALPKKQMGHWDKTREVAAGRMQQTAGAFRELYESIRESFQPEAAVSVEDPAVIFRQTAERQCFKCKQRELCWQQCFQDTQQALNDATAPMLARGRVEEEDFPAHFRARCQQFEGFLQVTGEELMAFLYRQQYEGRMRENRRTVCRQYAELDRILGKTAAELSAELTPDLPREGKLNHFLHSRGITEEGAVYYDEAGHLCVETPQHEAFTGETGREKLSAILKVPLREAGKADGKRLRFRQAEPFRAVAGVYGRSKEGEDVSGDAGTWFRRDDGLLCILLCDGMGSGAAARKESSLAVRMLENFLKAGVEPQAALATVNSALTLRGQETGGCTTVDLLTVELYTGACCIYKFGAAPSYLRKGDKVSRINGSALPAGIHAGEEVKPDITRFRGRAGDWIVLLSDGLVGGEDDTWVQEYIRTTEQKSPGKLAEALLAESEKHVQANDDSTVIAVRLEGRQQ